MKHKNVPLRMKIRDYLLLMWVLCLLVYTTSAQEATSPASPQETLTALQDVSIPFNDPYVIAQRLYGIQAPPAPTHPRMYQLGERDKFWVSNSNLRQTWQIMAELKFISQHAYFWVQVGQQVGDLHPLADVFDRDIYHPVRDIWGSEPYLGVDNDPRIHILFAEGLGFGVAAYFSRKHNYPEVVSPYSNAREMFFVNLSTIHDVNDVFLSATLAHEFQHMIRANITPNEDAWLNEAFSTFTEGYLGYPHAIRYPSAFLYATDTQLNTFGISSNRLAEYGAGYLFMTYLYDRYGLSAVQALSQHPQNGMFSVHHVVMDVGGITGDEFFADWVVANLVQDVNRHPAYGYRSLSNLPTPFAQRLGDWQNRQNRTLSQYATHYYRLADWRTGDTVKLQLNLPDVVRLIPIEPHSGERFWYSNRADVSHMRLYRTFDLSDVASATLTYHLWADLEPLWDYGYVFISADGGTSWRTLQTETMTTRNDIGNLYGEAGYSLTTKRWVKEQIMLDEYVGGEVIISFEVITDDAVNHAGMAIDDVAIAEIGYYSDFEIDNGGWMAEGWVWVTNHLPQYAWLQVIQHTRDSVIVDRWFVPTDAIAPVTIDDRTRSVFIAVSPIAQVTTIPVTYELIMTRE